MTAFLIQTINLCKTYPKAKNSALQDVSFEISSGDIYGLLGPNGAGKTTTLSILSGILKYDKGSVCYEGIEFNGHERSIQKQIGVVPQEIALYPTLTARENLTYFGRIYGLKGKHLQEIVEEYLNRLGLIEKADQRIDTFSGGMKRRTNLIAGLLHKPQILFLDEPTVGIDVQSKAVILEYLRELNKLGTTIVYSSHDLDEAERFCNRVAIMNHGKIVASGSINDLLNTDRDMATLQDLFLNLTGRELRD